MTKLPALTPDDPLRIADVTQPPQPAAAATIPVTAKESEHTPAPRRRRATRRPAPAPSQPTPQRTSEVEWTGATDVTTFRLPAEVLQELHQRSRALGLAKGMTVAAALLDLLEREDDQLVELVERTQQRYDSARRRARRAA